MTVCFGVSMHKRLLQSLILALLLTGCGGSGTSHQGAAQYLEAIRNDPALLALFVKGMPKGGDIHSHLVGVPYAESYLRWAADDDACIDITTWQILAAPCPEGARLVAEVIADQTLYHQAIDGLSMRNFPLEPPRYGHDHFFGVFSRFGLISTTHKPEMLAETATRAAADQTDYLELLITLQGDGLSQLIDQLPWTGDLATDYQTYVAGVRGLLAAGEAEIADLLTRQRAILGCEQVPAPPACAVSIRFIQQANRTSSNQWVFASLIFGAEMGARGTEVLGVDLVSPEDHPQALAHYGQHMAMLAFLRGKYPGLKISLHAGELTGNLVAPSELSFHISQAVRIAGANRLAHGVSLKNEPDWQGLVADMADQGVGLSILLTSNAQVLGVTGEGHPFLTYLDAGVPVMLGTDDQGISRSSHTEEFIRAIQDYGLTWHKVKRLVRTSLEQSFAPGDSLWRSFGAQPEPEPIPVAVCEGLALGEAPSAACQTYLNANDKAAEQWRLEGRLRRFESRYW